jgi:phytoene dehydrogenase-like protein
MPVLNLFTSEIFTRPFSYHRLVTKGWRHLYKFRGTVASELRALFSDEAVRAAMSGALLYSGVPPEKMPISLMLALVALFCDGCFLPEGGMGKIAVALRQAFETSGGELLHNSKVNKIVLRNDAIQGVEVEQHGFVEADAVISSVSGLATFGLLMQPEAVPKVMKRKVHTARLSHKPVSLQLGLSNRIDVPSYFNCVLPLMEKQDQVFMPDEPGAMWPVYAVPTMVLPDLAPPGGSIIEMYPTVRQDMTVDDWNEQEKEKITEAAIEALSPMHTLDIVAKRVRSPKEFRDDLHLYKGAVYGLSATTDPRALFPHTPPIRGLYLAGQTTYPGIGVSSSAMSGIFAAEEVLKAEGLLTGNSAPI